MKSLFEELGGTYTFTHLVTSFFVYVMLLDEINTAHPFCYNSCTENIPSGIVKRLLL